MLTIKPVLPNFLKTVLVASIASASVSAFAGHHEGAEEKIGDLKDMKAKSSQLKADELTSSLDESAADSALTEDSKKELEMKAKEIMDENAAKSEEPKL